MATAKKPEQEKESTEVVESKVYEPVKGYVIPTEDRIIYLKNLNPKRTKNYVKDVFRPAISRKTRQLVTGQPYFTPEEKTKVPLVVNEFTQYELIGIVELNLNDPIHAIHWGWLKHHPYVFESKEQAERSRHAQYAWYVDEPEKEAKDRNAKKKHAVEIQGLIYNLTYEKQKTLARYFNLDANVPASILEENLLNYAEDDYGRKPSMKDVINDKKKFGFIDIAFKAFETIDAEGKPYVEKDVWGQYKYQGSIIADTFDNFLEWLSKQEELLITLRNKG